MTWKNRSLFISKLPAVHCDVGFEDALKKAKDSITDGERIGKQF